MLAYVTRGDDVLVFRQPDFPEAGLQVPGGTVEEGEDLEAAVLREVREETGLSRVRVVRRLGSAERRWSGGVEERTWFHVACEGDAFARWHHVERFPSDGQPPIVFELFWAKLAGPGPGLAYDQGRFLEDLLRPAPPRIVITDRKTPVRCPFCRDDLDAQPTRCERCGTAYHAECARLAGRCGLMGCEGPFGRVVVGPRVAIVLRPCDESSDEQVELLARLMNVGSYDAILRLRTGVPLVVAWVAAEHVERELDALGAVGLAAFPVPAAELARADAAIVQRIEAASGPGELLLRTTLGERRLALDAPRTVVTGRYSTLMEETEPQRLDGGKPTKRVLRDRETARFIHVYDREGALLSFEENVLSDFRFLGERMAPSAVLNFQRLVELLSAGARVDRRLDQVRGTIATRTANRERRNVFTSTNRPWMDSASRLVYQSLAV